MCNTGKEWTEHDDKGLFDLLSCGTALRDIAAALGRTVPCIRARLLELIAKADR